MTLAKWDCEVAPYLHTIEAASRQFTGLAERVDTAIFILTSRPYWHTKAEEELQRAEEQAAATLERIRNARAKYAALPVVEG